MKVLVLASQMNVSHVSMLAVRIAVPYSGTCRRAPFRLGYTSNDPYIYELSYKTFPMPITPFFAAYTE